MNPTLKALNNELEALNTESAALIAKAERTDTDKERVAALPGLIAAKKAEIAAEKALIESQADANQFLNGAAAAVKPAVAGAAEPKKEVAAKVLSHGLARNLMSVGLDRVEAAQHAYNHGMWLLATSGHKKAQQYCQDNGLEFQSAQHIEGWNENGGYLVPPEFGNDLILLREKYGVFRQNARIVPMSSDTRTDPRQTGGLTAYWQDEAATVTESKDQWDRVGLTAKSLMVLTRASTQFNEDTIIDFGDRMSKDIAYAFAKKEDQAGFVGDGTSTYGKIKGVTTRLKDVFTATGGLGLYLGTGNAYNELVLGDFTGTIGLLPEYASDNPRWYCHKTFYHQVMEKIKFSGGGVTYAELSDSQKNPSFLGYPVVFAQAMPRTEANSQVPCVFGDLALAASFGDRRQTTLLMSEHVYFATNEIGIRGDERLDINVHDVGSSTEAGPMVGLIMAAA